MIDTIERILCHRAVVNGQTTDMAILTVDDGRLIDVSRFEGRECHSTSFVNGTVYVTTDRDGSITNITAADADPGLTCRICVAKSHSFVTH